MSKLQVCLSMFLTLSGFGTMVLANRHRSQPHSFRWWCAGGLAWLTGFIVGCL